MKPFEDGIAVVVGGTGAIGSEIVIRLLDSGCQVAVLTRGQTTSSLLESHQSFSDLSFYRTDIRSENEVQRSFREIRRSLGQVTYLIYCAGLKPDVTIPLTIYSYSDWLDCFNTYVTGFFLCFREIMQHPKDDSHILAISSAITRIQFDQLPPFHAGHYAMAKAALNEFCKWAKREANEQGILLSRIAPSAVDTTAQLILGPLVGTPYSVLPVAVVAERVINALKDRVQIDEEIVA